MFGLSERDRPTIELTHDKCKNGSYGFIFYASNIHSLIYSGRFVLSHSASFTLGTTGMLALKPYSRDVHVANTRALKVIAGTLMGTNW